MDTAMKRSESKKECGNADDLIFRKIWVFHEDQGSPYIPNDHYDVWLRRIPFCKRGKIFIIE